MREREPEASLALGRKLDSIPFGWFHLQVIAVLALVGFTEGYDTALTGSLVVLARKPLGLSETDITWLVIGPTAVLVLAMLAGSALSDRVSRKTVLQVGVMISTFFTLIIPLASTPAALIIIRMLGGIGFGLALPAAYPIGAELLPASHRKTFGWIYEIILALAFTAIPFVGSFASGSPAGWKIVALPGGLMLFVVPVLVWLIIPESPRWHLAAGRPDRARDAVNDLIRRTGGRVAPLNTTFAANAPRRAEMPPYAAIFAGPQFRRTLVAALTWMGALVSYYLFAFLLPKALVAQGYDIRLSFGLSSLLFFVTIPGKILNGYMMEWIGRRLTIFLAMFLSVFGLALMVIAHGLTGQILGMDARTFAFMLGVIVTGVTVLSCFPAVRIYMTEQFPTNLRGRGYFFAEMVGRAVAGIPIPFFMAGYIGSPTVFFGTILLFSLMGAFVPLLLGQETTGPLELVTEGAESVGAIPELSRQRG